jgi:hypothetical protein
VHSCSVLSMRVAGCPCRIGPCFPAYAHDPRTQPVLDISADSRGVPVECEERVFYKHRLLFYEDITRHCIMNHNFTGHPHIFAEYWTRPWDAYPQEYTPHYTIPVITECLGGCPISESALRKPYLVGPSTYRPPKQVCADPEYVLVAVQDKIS